MGRREDDRGQIFYSFDLDKVVPADHLARQIDGFADTGLHHCLGLQDEATWVADFAGGVNKN
jgi:hypothetical protein